MTIDDLENEQPFSYQVTKNEQVRISYSGKTVATLTGKDAVNFIARVEQDSTTHAQRLMAKATGNFKRGNERQSQKNGSNSDFQ